jgi:hypothetical protein
MIIIRSSGHSTEGHIQNVNLTGNQVETQLAVLQLKSEPVWTILLTIVYTCKYL